MQYGARNSKGSRRDRDRHVCKTLLGGRRKRGRAAKNAARLTETSDEVRTDNRADGRLSALCGRQQIKPCPMRRTLENFLPAAKRTNISWERPMERLQLEPPSTGKQRKYLLSWSEMEDSFLNHTWMGGWIARSKFHVFTVAFNAPGCFC